MDMYTGDMVIGKNNDAGKSVSLKKGTFFWRALKKSL